MKDDDVMNLQHTVDTLDGDLTELQKQVVELQKQNRIEEPAMPARECRRYAPRDF
jgi:cell division protein FtsL